MPGPASRFGLVALVTMTAGSASSCLLITDRFLPVPAGQTGPTPFGPRPVDPIPQVPLVVPSLPACIDDLVVTVDGVEVACDRPAASLAAITTSNDRDGEGTFRWWQVDGYAGKSAIRSGELVVSGQSRADAQVVARVVEQELGGHMDGEPSEFNIDAYVFDVERVPVDGFEGAMRAVEALGSQSHRTLRWDFSSKACFLTWLAYVRLAPRLNGERGGVGPNYVMRPDDPPTPTPTLSPS